MVESGLRMHGRTMRRATAGKAVAGELKRRTFHTLDALRGVAALLIVGRHSDQLFAGHGPTESYLAVDLFFVMSAVVVASAYGPRLRSVRDGWTFLGVRVVRLWPLYLVGLALGLLQLLATSASHHDLGAGLRSGGPAFLAALFMIPWSPPLSSPRWSLTFEIAINIVYGFTAPFLKTWTIVVAMVMSAAGLVAAELQHNTLDLGYDAASWMVGVWRVVYSFSAGLVVFRWYNAKARIAPVLALLLVVLTGGILGCSWHPGASRAILELATVLIGFPLIVAAALRIDVKGGLQKFFGFLGLTSYGIYIIHQPLALLFEAVLRHATHREPDVLAPFGGIAFLIVLITLAWALDYPDARVRALAARWLRLKDWGKGGRTSGPPATVQATARPSR